MEHLGERNELLHVRFGYMADRLEDLKTLTEDFNLLTKPIEEMATELPKARARIFEYEALLAREVQDSKAAKAELADLRDKYAIAVDERTVAHNRSRLLGDSMERSETELAGHRIRLGELETLLSTADRRSAAEADNRDRLEAEIAALTSENSRKDGNLLALGQQADRETGRADDFERETQRLKKTADNQVLQIVELQARHHDLEKSLHLRDQTIDELRAKLESERLDERKSSHAQNLVVSALSAEKASMLLRVDELVARLRASEQSSAQIRANLSERDNTIRLCGEQIQALSKDRATLERQRIVLDQQVTERSAELGEIRRISDEATKRADMLAKALSAKSAAFDGAVEQAQLRSDRADELAIRFEKERSTLESANRRLVEDLENERSERTLAQGALKIARESRASLQRQNEALKRSNRAMRNAAAEDDGLESEIAVDPETDGTPASRPGSNVSTFHPKPKVSDDAD